MPNLKDAIARFGASAKAKLANPAATGEPEDQLRAPLEALFGDVAELCGFERAWLAAVGESSLAKLKTRPPLASPGRLFTIRQTPCVEARSGT
jgi:hypothetical protein